MDKIFEVEKLNSIRNEMTHLWGSIFVTAGGTIALILEKNKEFLVYIFIIAGCFFTLLLINAYFIRRTEVVKILKSLEEEQCLNG